MYAEIHSRNFDAIASTGKKSWVNSREILVSVCRDRPKHIGYPPWYLKVEAECSDVKGSGAMGGDYLEIERKLEIHIEASDLERIVSLAIEQGLISLRSAWSVEAGQDDP